MATRRVTFPYRLWSPMRIRLPRDIIARACAQRHNLRVVGCIATRGEIMTSCLPSPPQVIVVSDSISEHFDEIIDALLAVGTRIIVICTNPSLERVIHLLESGSPWRDAR